MAQPGQPHPGREEHTAASRGDQHGHLLDREPGGVAQDHDEKSGWLLRTDSDRPFGSSQSSWRPRAVRSRK